MAVVGLTGPASYWLNDTFPTESGSMMTEEKEVIAVFAKDFKCDKCGRDVPPANDIAHLESIRQDVPLGWMTVQSRHFMPVEGCEGSPSRAQYIEGQPRDTRFPYVETDEPGWRAAYRKLLEMFGDMPDEDD